SGTIDTTFSNIVPGTGYSITETNPAPAFDMTSFTCDRGTTAAIQVLPGLTTTCTAVNVKRGAIKIVKNTTGGDGTFQFNPTGFGSGSFNLTTVGGTIETTFSNIAPGSGYSITETNP